ncbi:MULTISPECIES: hypothetical protein [unclassified Nostoc]|uniref:hypothetical protein n=1 Tax=unclassified Nostoc TaxID=2593658 RepID=UPI0025AA8C52|nr:MULTISPECIES: hypothetical protein [unclassified Nostoc]MDM9586257.1 hypothetical protein [Nostoc sp. GT001]MDZ7943748.1 hypothetical protein [Nostoc sp. EfeVER01]MDZ7990821.1 hypothetical protein [Nostoc sp. EspVER01]
MTTGFVFVETITISPPVLNNLIDRGEDRLIMAVMKHLSAVGAIAAVASTLSL